MGERYDHIFSESNTDRPIFGRMVEISMAELPKPTNEKTKNNNKKKRFFLKFDLEVVAHSELVQNTSKTPNLSISDHISSQNYHLRTHPGNLDFFAFLRILRKTKSSY